MILWPLEHVKSMPDEKYTAEIQVSRQMENNSKGKKFKNEFEKKNLREK